jgi:hypothetical protein
VVATRTSKRVPRDGVLIATKATNRAMAKNDTSGTSASHNPFTVLNNSGCSILQDVMSDLDIVADNLVEQIDVLKAEELARAAIAEANCNCYLDKLKDRTKPKDDGDLDDLAMKVISIHREVLPFSPRGWGEESL